MTSEVALAKLVSHAASFSPYYRSQPWAARVRSGQRVSFRDLPLTAKSVVKADPTAFHSDSVPESEGPTCEKATSGSTGEPSLVLKTKRHYVLNDLENGRLRQNWRMGWQTGFLTIEARSPDRASDGLTKTGERHWRVRSVDARDWMKALQSTEASFLQCSPSKALLVLEHAPPLEFLRVVSTSTEIIPDELKAAIARQPECRLLDTYGSVETGVIAVTCGHCGRYHLAGRHAIIEVLDEQGRPCEPGVMGRVVVTPLYNLAMPLLRFELGDYAIPAGGPECLFARRSLSQIVGRERNLFKLPDGARVVPWLPHGDALALGVRKFKLMQTTLQDVQFLYIPDERDLEVDADVVQRLIDVYVSPRLRVVPVRVDSIPAAPNGKYLLHESLVD